MEFIELYKCEVTKSAEHASRVWNLVCRGAVVFAPSTTKTIFFCRLPINSIYIYRAVE